MHRHRRPGWRRRRPLSEIEAMHRRSAQIVRTDLLTPGSNSAERHLRVRSRIASMRGVGRLGPRREPVKWSMVDQAMMVDSERSVHFVQFRACVLILAVLLLGFSVGALMAGFVGWAIGVTAAEVVAVVFLLRKLS